MEASLLPSGKGDDSECYSFMCLQIPVYTMLASLEVRPSPLYSPSPSPVSAYSRHSINVCSMSGLNLELK